MENIFSLKIRKDKVIGIIKQTSGLGIAVAILTLISAFIVDPLIVYLLIALIVFVLSIGIYFKSRFCVVLLFAIYSADMFLIFIFGSIRGGEVSTMVAPIVIHIFFLILFLKGVKAIFIYHKYIKNLMKNETGR